MKQLLWIALLGTVLVVSVACVRRMAPFAPHRTNTEDHRLAQTNQACLVCHPIADLGKGHQATDNCLRCHRIVQGD